VWCYFVRHFSHHNLLGTVIRRNKNKIAEISEGNQHHVYVMLIYRNSTSEFCAGAATCINSCYILADNSWIMLFGDFDSNVSSRKFPWKVGSFYRFGTGWYPEDSTTNKSRFRNVETPWNLIGNQNCLGYFMNVICIQYRAPRYLCDLVWVYSFSWIMKPGAYVGLKVILAASA
jgi:hypothetical protein